MDHTFNCKDCDMGSKSAFLGLTFSDAEWHNTNTGHDVELTEADGTHWEQTGSATSDDAGWEKMRSRITAITPGEHVGTWNVFRKNTDDDVWGSSVD